MYNPNAEVFVWLLEEENPSVRYSTLKDLMDQSNDDEHVKESKNNIMQQGYVPALLEKMQSETYISRYPRFYTDKYKGLVWALIILAEHGAGKNSQIDAYCEYLLQNAQEIGEGGFSMHASAKNGGGRLSEVIPCLTGNMVWALLHFGYFDDQRLQKSIDWLVKYSRFNDGEESVKVPPPYDRYEICWGKHTCFMATVKMLKAFSAIPETARNKEVQQTIESGVEFLLVHHLYKQSHNLMKKSKPGWLRFAFPLMYQTDLLEILDTLTGLGVKDPRMADALSILESKQDIQGRWHLENTYINERMLLPIGGKDEPSKALTLRALRTLKRYYGQST